MQWTPASGLSTQTAKWLVSGSTATSPVSTPTPGGTSTPGSTPTSEAPTATAAPGATNPGQAVNPADIVKAYFNAINDHDYQKAWDLGGKNTTSSYASFVSGFSTTATVSVEILDISGDPGAGVVTARVTALQTDGTTKVFQGTYTVKNGVIAEFDVHQVS